MKITLISIISVLTLTGCNVHLKGEADVGMENPYERNAE